MILTKTTKNRIQLLHELGNNIRIVGDNHSQHDSFLTVEENGEIYLKNELEFPLVKDKDLVVGNKYMCSVNKYRFNPVSPFIYAGHRLVASLITKRNSVTGEITIKVILSRENLFKKTIQGNFIHSSYTNSMTKIYEVCGENYPLDDFEEWKRNQNVINMNGRRNKFDNTEEFIAEINHLVRTNLTNNTIEAIQYVYCYNLKKSKSLQNLIESNIQLTRNNII